MVTRGYLVSLFSSLSQFYLQWSWRFAICIHWNLHAGIKLRALWREFVILPWNHKISTKRSCCHLHYRHCHHHHPTFTSAYAATTITTTTAFHCHQISSSSSLLSSSKWANICIHALCWWQQLTPKCWYLLSKLQSAMSQKPAALNYIWFRAVDILNLAFWNTLMFWSL